MTMARMLAERIGARLSAFDDGHYMRAAFYGLLSASLVFVLIDLEEIHSASQASITGPSTQIEAVPALPPVLTDGEPQGAPFDLSADPGTLRQPIRFELQAGGLLLATGTIDAGAAERFRAEIEARGEYVTTVLLNSPGGSVEDALAISSLIRERKFATRVEDGGFCASSCPIVFAGGEVRIAGERAVVGVHQVFSGSGDRPSPEQAMSSAQSMTARVSRHLEGMGVASGLWLHALETPPDRLYYLTFEEMQALKLVTGDTEPSVSG